MCPLDSFFPAFPHLSHAPQPPSSAPACTRAPLLSEPRAEERPRGQRQEEPLCRELCAAVCTRGWISSDLYGFYLFFFILIHSSGQVQEGSPASPAWRGFTGLERLLLPVMRARGAAVGLRRDVGSTNGQGQPRRVRLEVALYSCCFSGRFRKGKQIEKGIIAPSDLGLEADAFFGAGTDAGEKRAIKGFAEPRPRGSPRALSCHLAMRRPLVSRQP